LGVSPLGSLSLYLCITLTLLLKLSKETELNALNHRDL
jgi:hypothetical protein